MPKRLSGTERGLKDIAAVGRILVGTTAMLMRVSTTNITALRQCVLVSFALEHDIQPYRVLLLFIMSRATFEKCSAPPISITTVAQQEHQCVYVVTTLIFSRSGARPARATDYERRTRDKDNGIG